MNPLLAALSHGGSVDASKIEFTAIKSDRWEEISDHPEWSRRFDERLGDLKREYEYLRKFGPPETGIPPWVLDHAEE